MTDGRCPAPRRAGGAARASARARRRARRAARGRPGAPSGLERLRPPRPATSSASCAASSALWEVNATRELPVVARARGAGSPRAVPESGERRRRPRRLPARQRHARASTRRRGSWPCSTGSSRRSATRSPTSATSSRPGPTPRLARDGARCCSPGHARAPASRPGPSSSSATRSAAGAPVERARVVRGARALEGGGLLRGALRPLPARRARRRLGGGARRGRPSAPRARGRGRRAFLEDKARAYVEQEGHEKPREKGNGEKRCQSSPVERRQIRLLQSRIAPDAVPTPWLIS